MLRLNIIKRHLSNLPKFSNKLQIIPTVTKTITNKEMINKNRGLNNFMLKTLSHTGLGVGSTLIVATVLSYSPELTGHYPIMMGCGLLTAIGGCFGLCSTKYLVHTKKFIDKDTNETCEELYSENTFQRSLAYTAIIGGTNLSVAPLLAIANIQGLLLPTTFSTILVFSGAMHYAYNCDPKSLGPIGPALNGCLIALIGSGFTGLASTLMFGPNIFSIFMHNINVYAGIPLFTAFIAYDINQAILMYNDRNPDHYGCSVILYLDFINLLTRIVEITDDNQKI